MSLFKKIRFEREILLLRKKKESQELMKANKLYKREFSLLKSSVKQKSGKMHHFSPKGVWLWQCGPYIHEHEKDYTF